MKDNFCNAYCVSEAFELLSTDISPMERADILAFLTDEEKLTSQDISNNIGMKDYTIRHYQIISRKLENECRWLLHNNKISFSQARVICQQPTSEQENLARKVISNKVSAHKLRGKLSDKGTSEETVRYFERLSDIIAQQKGLDISIRPNSTKKNHGEIKINYTSLDDFDNFLAALSINTEEI